MCVVKTCRENILKVNAYNTNRPVSCQGMDVSIQPDLKKIIAVTICLLQLYLSKLPTVGHGDCITTDKSM